MHKKALLCTNIDSPELIILTIIYYFCFSFSGNRQPVQCTQSCSSAKAGASRSKVGSIPGIRRRHAHSFIVFLHACCPLARLYMVIFVDHCTICAISQVMSRK